MEETKIQWLVIHRYNEGMLSLSKINVNNEVEGVEGIMEHFDVVDKGECDINEGFRIAFTNRINGEVYVRNYTQNEIHKCCEDG